MNAVKFWSLFFFLVALLVGLIACAIYQVEGNTAQSMALAWLVFNQIGPLCLIGFGLAIPTVCIAILFGWIHTILIMNGMIDPHLSSKGFLEALHTLMTTPASGR